MRETESRGGGSCAVNTLNTPEVLLIFKVRFYQTASQDVFCVMLRINQSRDRVESQPSVLCCHQPTVLLKRTFFNPGFFLGAESFQWLSKLW